MTGDKGGTNIAHFNTFNYHTRRSSMKRFLSILLAAIILSFNGPDLSIAEGIAREGTTEDDAAIEAVAEEGPQGNPAPIELSPTTYRLGGFPRAAALSDIDSDGNLDLA